MDRRRADDSLLLEGLERGNAPESVGKVPRVLGETGYTTITTTHTATYCPTTTPAPRKDYATYPPPGFEVTTKVCNYGCGSGPTTVTVTIPCSKCGNSYPTGKPEYPTHDKPEYPTHDKPEYPTHDKPEYPAYPKPTKPAYPVDETTTKVYQTKVITLSKIAIPESEYYALYPSAPAPAYPEGDKPTKPTHADEYPSKPYPTPAGDKPGKPYYPGGTYAAGNETMQYGTGYVKPSASKTGGYPAVPEFTGAAASVRAGGVLAFVAAAAMLL